MITNVGKNLLIDSGIRGQTQTSTWYVGLIDYNNFGVVLPTDTAAEHSGWEENTDYTAATRQQITFDEATGGKSTNGTVVTLTTNAAVSIIGYFVISNNTKGGDTGTLLSTHVFKGPVSYDNAATINITIQL